LAVLGLFATCVAIAYWSMGQAGDTVRKVPLVGRSADWVRNKTGKSVS